MQPWKIDQPSNTEKYTQQHPGTMRLQLTVIKFGTCKQGNAEQMGSSCEQPWNAR